MPLFRKIMLSVILTALVFGCGGSAGPELSLSRDRLAMPMDWARQTRTQIMGSEYPEEIIDLLGSKGRAAGMISDSMVRNLKLGEMLDLVTIDAVAHRGKQITWRVATGSNLPEITALASAEMVDELHLIYIRVKDDNQNRWVDHREIRALKLSDGQPVIWVQNLCSHYDGHNVYYLDRLLKCDREAKDVLKDAEKYYSSNKYNLIFKPFKF